MSMSTLARHLAAAALCVSALTAADPGTLQVKILAMNEKGVVGDIGPQDWKLQVGGKDAKVLAQRSPAEVSKEGQKWAFVLLPMRGSDIRALSIQAIAEFMKDLPPSDSVLLVMRSSKGLECLTPGFTTRPSLWAAGLKRAYQELPTRLAGNAPPTFVLPPPPANEAGEGMEPVLAFLKELAAAPPQRSADEVAGRARSIMEDYPTNELGGVTKMAQEALLSLENLGEAVAKVGGEKHLVVFSRNEVDDLANPVWARSVSSMAGGGLKDQGSRGGKPLGLGTDPNAEYNPKVHTTLMIKDMVLALESLKAKYANLGMTLHSVGGSTAAYGGALSAIAMNTGGFSFRFGTTLVPQFAQLLPLWASRYELSVAVPGGQARPASIDVSLPRKGLNLFWPKVR